MSLPNELHPLQLAAGSAAAYEIDQSLRFDGSSKLSRTNGAGGNLRTFTQSFWVKRNSTTTDVIFEAWGSTTDWATTAFSTGLLSQNRVSGTTYGVNTANVSISYRDFSAWMHVVISYSNAVPTIYVNGSEVSTPNNNSSDWHFLRNGYPMTIGSRSINDPDEYLNGYLAEVHFVDGTALNQYDFGKTDPITGAWIPKEYTGSHGTQGFYLKFDPTATNGIGHDHSGNGNNFTPSGFVTSGTGTDVMSDTPTNNYATLNALAKGSTLTMSDGNLAIYGGHGTTTSTIAVTSGMKAYMEYQISSSFVNGSSACGFGVAQKTDPYSSFPGNASDLWWVYQSNQWSIYPSDGGGGAYDYPTGKSLSGNTAQIAIDYDAGKVWIGINNTWYTSSNASNGNPSAGTGEMFSTTFTKPVHFLLHIAANVTNYANFGQRAFAYTPPTGFKALNTQNLPEPTIKDGGKYFNTLLYTGTGGTKAVSGAGFQPDLVWIKNRSRANSSHVVVDAVRGATKALSTNIAGTEVTTNGTDDFRSFDSDGFTVGDSSNFFVNSIGDTHAAWLWKEGISNGFDIVSYEGTGSTQNISHNLNAQPAFVIVKTLDNGRDWYCYHQSLGAGKTILLSYTGGEFSSTNYWNNTAPSSTVFTVGSDVGTNELNNTYIAYCFSEVAGYSKFGSYTGNGSSDGPFVFTGFKVAWLMWKRIDSTANWFLMDAARNTYNVVDKEIYPDRPDAENTFTDVDFLSNGFKLRASAADRNASGGTFVYAAFAELPFKYANAR